ncbi:MAG: hypothetical protein ACXVFU_16405 [Nocardioidaceae bacterium]
MNLLTRGVTLLLGGGLFGAGTVSAADTLARVARGSDLTTPLGSGLVAGLGLGLLLFGAVAGP